MASIPTDPAALSAEMLDEIASKLRDGWVLQPLKLTKWEDGIGGFGKEFDAAPFVEAARQFAAIRDAGGLTAEQRSYLESQANGSAFRDNPVSAALAAIDSQSLRLSKADREYRELWCAVWCCPLDEYSRSENPSEDWHKTHKQTCDEAVRQAMRLAAAVKERDEL